MEHTLTMRLPAKVLPSRHIVEPQSPLCLVRKSLENATSYIPEVGNDLVTAVRNLLVLLWGTFGDLEPIIRVDGVAGISAATDLATI